MKALVPAPALRRGAVDCLVAALLIGLAAGLQFVFTGANWFNVTQSWRVYAGVSDWHTIPPAYQFDLEAVVPALIGGLLISPGQSDQQWVVRYTMVGAVLFVAVLLAAVAVRRLTPLQVFFVLTLGQVVKVTLPWMGKPDLFLLSFLLICALWSDHWVGAVGGALSVLSHPSVALIGIVALVFGRWALGVHRIGPAQTQDQLPGADPSAAADPPVAAGQLAVIGSRCWQVARSVPALWPLIGVLLGWLIQQLVMELAFPGHISRSTMAAAYGMPLLVNAIPNAMAFTVLTLAAIMPPIMLGIRPGPDRAAPLSREALLRRAVLVAVVAVIMLVAMFAVLDHSRIAALLGFPLVVTAVLRYRRQLELALTEQPALLIFLVVISMAVPPLAENGWIGYRFAPLAEWLDAVVAASKP